VPEYFTVDRAAALSAGEVLDLDLDRNVQPRYEAPGYFSGDDYEDLAQELFPDGLSLWGKGFLFNPYLSPSTREVSPTIEMLVELVRRNSFPELPSRFSCIFASSTIDDARQFRDGYGTPSDPIFRVACNKAYRHDNDLLRLGPSFLTAWLFSTKYWRGESGPDPKWEELLVPPVQVLERVE
jgi:hypothetical protein